MQFRKFSALLVLLLFAACRGQDRPVEIRRVRLAAGTPGGGFQSFGDALAQAYKTQFPSISIELIGSAGVIKNLEALQFGQADIGFAFADSAYMAFAGLGPSHEQFDKLRGIAVLQLNPVHLIARAGSGIQGVADLRGKRVGIGPPETGTSQISSLLMSAYNIDTATAMLDSSRPAEATARLESGRMDALFLVGSDPVEPVTQVLRSGATLIPLRGSTIEEFRHQHPFFRRTVITAGTYPNQTSAIETIGVDNIIVCSSQLDEPTVYAFTKALFEILPNLRTQQQSLRSVDLERTAATPIPLHNGAARYYRERQIAR
jgi:uncharacterized protein